MILSINTYIIAGSEAKVIDSLSPGSTSCVVFEDDQTTGYFYAVDVNNGLKIQDALHVYTVDRIPEQQRDCNLKITWSEDGQLAALLINDYCHAVFDFASRAGYCRTGFPSCNSDWCRITQRQLTDDLCKELMNKYQ